jgi:two-component sensor histidine kinase
MRGEGHADSLRHDLQPLMLGPDASISLGMVATEWVTNAVKYAYPGSSGEVRVSLSRLPDGRGQLAVEDDGVGRPHGDRPKGTGLGTRIVRAMAATIGGEVEYMERNPGTAARLLFPLPSPQQAL